MSKKVRLERLREISKQRSVRTLHGENRDVEAGTDSGAPLEDEWPIRSSLWL